MKFLSREQAGEKLSRELKLLDLADAVVLAIPRGGVPVGSAVARALACPMDVIPLLKIPIPWSPEASYGAVVADGTLALNQPLLRRLEISESELKMATAMVMQEVRRRERAYRSGRPFPSLAAKTAILADDGLGSGYSMLAAVNFVKKRNPGAVVIASPVASNEAYHLLSSEPGIGRLVVLVKDTSPVFSLSSFYKEFKTLTDDDVMHALSGAVG